MNCLPSPRWIAPSIAVMCPGARLLHQLYWWEHPRCEKTRVGTLLLEASYSHAIEEAFYWQRELVLLATQASTVHFGGTQGLWFGSTLLTLPHKIPVESRWKADVVETGLTTYMYQIQVKWLETGNFSPWAGCPSNSTISVVSSIFNV
jgi:hypothetical protein